MKIFEAVNMNWEHHGPGDWDNTKYSVFDDGRIKRIITGGYDAYDGPQSCIFHMEAEQLNELKALLPVFAEQNMQQGCVKGEGWRMTTFGPHNKVLDRKEGYIYGVEVLEKLAALMP